MSSPPFDAELPSQGIVEPLFGIDDSLELYFNLPLPTPTLMHRPNTLHKPTSLPTPPLHPKAYVRSGDQLLQLQDLNTADPQVSSHLAHLEDFTGDPVPLSSLTSPTKSTPTNPPPTQYPPTTQRVSYATD